MATFGRGYTPPNDGRLRFDMTHSGDVNGIDKTIGLNPIEKLNEIVLESARQKISWLTNITSWATIQRGTVNQIRVKQRANPKLAMQKHFGVENKSVLKLSANNYLNSRGKFAVGGAPAVGFVNKLVLPEGSSGPRASFGLGGGTVFRTNGVVPIGMWDTFTEEQQLFQTATDVAEQFSYMGEVISDSVDYFYRDVLINTAAFRIDMAEDNTIYSTVKSPTLPIVIDHIINDMRAFGVKGLHRMTNVADMHNTYPVATSIVLYVPPEVRISITKNPEFKNPEYYGGQKIHENEIGILGEARIVVMDNLPIEDDGNGRGIATMIMIGNDPLTGLKLEGNDVVDTTFIPYNNKTRDNPLGRVGVFGAAAWVGALNLNPERTAIIKAYANINTLEEDIKAYKECAEPICGYTCTEDMTETSCEKPNGTDDGNKQTIVKVGEDASEVKHVTYPDDLTNTDGSYSKLPKNKAAVTALQDEYGDLLISQKEFKDMYPDADYTKYIAGGN